MEHFISNCSKYSAQEKLVKTLNSDEITKVIQPSPLRLVVQTKQGSLRLRYVNAWPLVSVASCRQLGYVALLEKLCDWECSLRHRKLCVISNILSDSCLRSRI